MLDLAAMGQYVPGDSFVHRLDPRTKLVAVVLYSTLIFVVRTPTAFTLAAGFALVAVLLARIGPRFLWRGLRPILIFLAITFVLNVMLTEGQPWIKLGPVTVTHEGVRIGAQMAARLILLVLFSSLLTLTTTPIALTDGLERLLRPFRSVGLPATELALMMTIALRFIPTLLDEAERILKAQQARGARFQVGGPLAQIRAMIPVLVPLFVAAFRRADDLALAMEARGYRGGAGRTRMKELNLSYRDVLAGVVLVAYVGVVVRLRWPGGA